ncbi:MAG: right-handed parallel beta-helix repeat-containing protein [Lewinellaceae bacterium]|nr:right-handed parallel beta-helix repeat-containing protein [Lewinellaceae bacterium]
MRRIILPAGIFLLAVCTGCQTGPKEIILQPGMTIRESCTIKADTFFLPGADSLDRPVLTIEGNDIAIDFSGAVLVGNPDPAHPDQFSGLGILVREGKNISLKNLTVRGYKVGLMAQSVDSLRIENADFSYNYRQHLLSWREHEDLSDWLSYHHNENDEWLRYGAGIYLKNCPNALVRETRITGGQNGLMLTGCNNGLFYNNTIQYNSGVGLGLYRSSDNRLLHNKLDWNVRGHSPGFYRRGQDSAGILCYEQSSRNTFAYNSATHSGDGFFLWAGQETMDTGQGGCNDNLLFSNDFSFAPTNGIEVTFSSNNLIHNKISGCRYGIWGGYSYKTVISGNEIRGNEYGIAIEQGQDNAILNNLISDGKIGIQLWARDEQPADWGYANAKNVSSRNYQISGNCLYRLKEPLKISQTNPVQFGEEAPPSDSSICLTFDEKWMVAPLPDGMNTQLSENAMQGTDYILLDEWGPYNFVSPTIWLRAIEGNRYTFLLLGPPGNWRLDGATGWASVNQKTGTFPAGLVAIKEPGAQVLSLDLTYLGPAFVDGFGRTVNKGKPYSFSFHRVEPDWTWKVAWYNADGTETDSLKTQKPVAADERSDLFYAWWGAPAEGVDADRFVTLATGTLHQIPKGDYTLLISSDDGVRVWVDGNLVLDHWDVHEPVTDEISIHLEGDHEIKILHFEAGGFATLSARLLLSF